MGEPVCHLAGQRADPGLHARHCRPCQACVQPGNSYPTFSQLTSQKRIEADCTIDVTDVWTDQKTWDEVGLIEMLPVWILMILKATTNMIKNSHPPA